MAYYDQNPNNRKPRRPQTDSEEWYGERRSSRGRRPSGNRRDEGGRRPGGEASGRYGAPARGRGDRDERRPQHGDSARGGYSRPRPRRDLEELTPVRRGHADFEYKAPETAPVREERPERPSAPQELPENMLIGRNPIREALKSGRDLEKLLVQRGELSGSARQIVQMAREARVPVQEVEKSRLDELTPHHQGMIAFASAYAYATVEDMLALANERGEAPFLLILDGITDPQNLGAMIRSAECAGAHGVIVRERRSVGLTPAAVKASAGAVAYIPVARVTNLNRLIDELKAQHIWVYALTMDGQDYRQVAFEGGTALVVGSEGEGISHLTEEKCDAKVALPVRGRIDSLNASVAAGIVMYRVLAARDA